MMTNPVPTPTIPEILRQFGFDVDGNPDGDTEEVFAEATRQLEQVMREIIGKPLELRGDVDNRLREYVPDIDERRVDGVSPSFTNLYTRAIVNSVIECQNERLSQALGMKEEKTE